MNTYVAAYCLFVGGRIGMMGHALRPRAGARGADRAVVARLSCRRDIDAKTLMAVILLVAAWAGWRGYPAPGSAWLGLGMVIYSTINSAGYYAQRRAWGPLAQFAVLLAGAVVAVLRIGIAG